MENPKRLYRSRTSSVIGGVAGGLALHLNTDPLLWRILFILATFFGGGGLIVYIVMWIVVPLEPYPASNNLMNENMETENTGNNQNIEPGQPREKKHRNDGGIMGGIILITLGILFLIGRFIPKVDFGDLWPFLLIVIGAILIYKSTQFKS